MIYVYKTRIHVYKCNDIYHVRNNCTFFNILQATHHFVERKCSFLETLWVYTTQRIDILSVKYNIVQFILKDMMISSQIPPYDWQGKPHGNKLSPKQTAMPNKYASWF